MNTTLEAQLWLLPLKNPLRCWRCRKVLAFEAEVVRLSAGHGGTAVPARGHNRTRRIVQQLSKADVYTCEDC